MNSLFDALPMPGSAAPVSAAAALPSLAPASPADDDSWAQSLAAAEPPEQDADGSWGAGVGEPDPEDDDAAPTGPLTGAGAGQTQVGGVDDILDEIDSVLETNAAAFVQGFVQKGGQ